MSAVTVEHTSVEGWVPALRGMRNAMNSWDRADSDGAVLGPNDLSLCCRLIRTGSPDRKFLRMIIVWADLTAPLDLWAELDTYRHGRERNSCSTMNSLGRRDLTAADFHRGNVSPAVLDDLNERGRAMRAGKRTAEAIEDLKERLPSGFLLKSTMMFSYETLLKLHGERVNHRLSAWKPVCRWIETLPNMPAFLAAASGVRGDK